MNATITEQLDAWRTQINLIDSEIIKLIAKRNATVELIGKYKLQHGLAIFNEVREAELKLLHNQLSVKYGIPIEFIAELFELIIKHSRILQNKTVSINTTSANLHSRHSSNTNNTNSGSGSGSNRDSDSDSNLVRLNKYLKDNNICSRRKADDFIAKGYIKVNGIIITELGYKVDPKKDTVEVLPELIQEKSQFRYILLNKPIGYTCSKNSAEGKIIFELLPKINELTYAGRLDKDSHGLLILSNDGEFVYKIAGSEFKLEKEYIVRVNKPLTVNYLDAQANGTIRLDGKQVRCAKVEAIDNVTYSITLTEGINRQIRRMAENQGYKVLDLERVRIGGIVDNIPKAGAWRDLTNQELDSINRHFTHSV